MYLGRAKSHMIQTENRVIFLTFKYEKNQVFKIQSLFKSFEGAEGNQTQSLMIFLASPCLFFLF